MRPRGAIPTSRHVLAAARPHQVCGATPPQLLIVPPQLSYWNNQVDGCCVTSEEAFAKAVASVMAGQPELFIIDATALTWATRHGVLNGAVISDVLHWMQSDGFQQDGQTYNDGAPAAVDWTNAATMQNALAQGPVKLGVVGEPLEQVVGSSNGWFASGLQKSGQEDHCVGCCGYGPIGWLLQGLGASLPAGANGNAPGYAVFTWRTIGVLDVPSFLAIVFEAWLRSPTTVIGGATPPAPAPTALTLAEVDAALDAETAALAAANRWLSPASWQQIGGAYKAAVAANASRQHLRLIR